MTLHIDPIIDGAITCTWNYIELVVSVSMCVLGKNKERCKRINGSVSLWSSKKKMKAARELGHGAEEEEEDSRPSSLATFVA